MTLNTTPENVGGPRHGSTGRMIRRNTNTCHFIMGHALRSSEAAADQRFWPNAIQWLTGTKFTNRTREASV